MRATRSGAAPNGFLAAAANAYSGELSALARQLRGVTARVHARGHRGFSGVGSGVVWSRGENGGGLVVTNAHVVPGARGRWPIVELADDRAFEARLVARDPRGDLALLVLEDSGQELEAAKLGDARVLRTGELLVALGHPFGIPGAMSLGVVHAVPGETDWLRADIRLAPGNSGGPLATLDGAIVGVNSMIVGGLGVAIPTHVVERFVRSALSESTHEREQFTVE
jgi:serine protease Do